MVERVQDTIMLTRAKKIMTLTSARMKWYERHGVPTTCKYCPKPLTVGQRIFAADKVKTRGHQILAHLECYEALFN